MLWKKKNFLAVIFLFLALAAVYLPHIGGLTYYKDDWYYIYDGMIGGTKVFHEMFRVDRPARGFFFEWCFSLFGVNPLPWHAGAFAWRVLSAVGALWIFNILWKKEQRFSFLAALLFGIYPGYFWWISAIEYQPMIASLALQVFSIVFTLKAIETQSRGRKIAYGIGSIFTGWVYIALVDYAIGMEAFRFLCVFLLVNREFQGHIWKRLRNTLKAWTWTLIIPLGFTFWRTFFFVNERKATDIGAQLSVFVANPLATVIEWFFQLYRSLLNLSVLAWLDQFPSFIQSMRLRDISYGLLLSIIFVLLVALVEKRMNFPEEDGTWINFHKQTAKEALILGGLGMFFGAIPVVMANRYINIVGYSHYGLPASLAAAVFMAGVFELIPIPRLRTVAIYVIIGFAALSHYGIAMSVKAEEKALQRFWWEVSWRVPALQKGTLLVTHYPLPSMKDNASRVVEAANVLYFPNPTGQIPVRYSLAGVNLSTEKLPNLLSGSLYDEFQYRSHIVSADYGNFLVMSQPSVNSCVHVLNPDQPVISILDPVEVSLVAPFSKIENVLTDVSPAIPPEHIYGREPEHGWCFYFEKADLAAQLGHWEEVVSLGSAAVQNGYSPDDHSEWMPFLKAYAITGRDEQLKSTAKRVIGEKSLRVQACEILSKIQVSLTQEVKDVIAVSYCKTGTE